VTLGFGVALASLGAALASWGMTLLLFRSLERISSRARAALRAGGRVADGVLAPLRRAGVEGRDATRAERRRLGGAFALASLPVTFALVDALPAVALSGASALLAPRALVWRRERYTRRLDEGAASAATQIADALASGHTTRAAIALAARGLDGPIGHELSRLAGDLELGAATDAALVRFRERAASRRIDVLVAAMRLQGRSGGNLASLLRDVAAALEDQGRLEADARAETAQARFTSTVVLAMPLCVVALYELVAPGSLARLTGSAIGVALVGSAIALQLIGALLIRRLARVEA
jgi:tight adherence protein B